MITGCKFLTQDQPGTQNQGPAGKLYPVV